MPSPRPRRGRAARLSAQAAPSTDSLPALSDERLTEIGLEPPEKKTGRILHGTPSWHMAVAGTGRTLHARHMFPQ